MIATGYMTDTVANFPGGPSAGLGSWDPFVVRYGSGGTLLDSRRDGGTGNDTGRALSHSSEASFSYAGSFEGSLPDLVGWR